MRHEDEVLRRWCREAGRNSDEIERSLLPGIAVVRRSEREVKKVVDEIRRVKRGFDTDVVQAAVPEQIVNGIAPYLDLGLHSMQFDLPAPFDLETLELAQEVRPGAEARLKSHHV